ncbi:MAG: mechanosensitive ion channel family protein [Candidatus Paceibacterota bacterium]
MDELMLSFQSQPVVFIGASIVWILVLVYLINIFFDFLIKNVLSKTKTRLDDKIASVAKRTFLGVLLLSAVYILISYIYISEEYVDLTQKSVMIAFLLLFLGSGSQVVSVFFTEIELASRKRGDNSLSTIIPFLRTVTRFGLIAFALLVALSMLGVDITPALASAGVVGVGVAFASKDLVANLFGGISVFFDKPYKVGDYVIIQDNYRGEVVEIGMRSTKIKTRDNVLLTVPNSVMVTNAVVNETGYDARLRVRIPLQVSYTGDLENIEKKLVDLVSKTKNVKLSEEPKVRFRKFGESGINLEVLVVVDEPAARGKIVHKLIKAVHAYCRQAKIVIPYQQLDVHLYKTKRSV